MHKFYTTSCPSISVFCNFSHIFLLKRSHLSPYNYVTCLFLFSSVFSSPASVQSSTSPFICQAIHIFLIQSFVIHLANHPLNSCLRFPILHPSVLSFVSLSFPFVLYSWTIWSISNCEYHSSHVISVNNPFLTILLSHPSTRLWYISRINPKKHLSVCPSSISVVHLSLYPSVHPFLYPSTMICLYISLPSYISVSIHNLHPSVCPTFIQFSISPQSSVAMLPPSVSAICISIIPYIHPPIIYYKTTV